MNKPLTNIVDERGVSVIGVPDITDENRSAFRDAYQRKAAKSGEIQIWNGTGPANGVTRSKRLS